MNDTNDGFILPSTPSDGDGLSELEHALATKIAVEQAKGILVERHGIDPAEADDALADVGRGNGMTQEEIAWTLVREQGRRGKSER